MWDGEEFFFIFFGAIASLMIAILLAFALTPGAGTGTEYNHFKHTCDVGLHGRVFDTGSGLVCANHDKVLLRSDW